MSRAIPLLPLCAVRPVQSLSACTRDALYLLYRPCLTSLLFKNHFNIFFLPFEKAVVLLQSKPLAPKACEVVLSEGLYSNI